MKKNIIYTMIALSIFLLLFYFNSAIFVSKYIRMSESIHNIKELIGLSVFLMLIAVSLSFLLNLYLLKSTYKHKNKLIFSNILLMISIIIQALGLMILNKFTTTTSQIELVIIWLNTHNYVPLIFGIGCIVSSVQMAITLYFICNYKLKKDG